jgi:hypothetical protein
LLDLLFGGVADAVQAATGSRVSNAQATRAFLAAIAMQARWYPRRSRTASAYRDSGSVRLAARCSTARAPMTSSVLKYGSPRLVMCPSRVLPPVEYWRRTRPSQAAKCGPFLKSRPWPTVATRAEAVMGPMPMRVCVRRASAFELTCTLISCSYSWVLAARRAACSRRSRAQATTRVGSFPAAAAPCAAPQRRAAAAPARTPPVNLAGGSTSRCALPRIPGAPDAG